MTKIKQHTDNGDGSHDSHIKDENLFLKKVIRENCLSINITNLIIPVISLPLTSHMDETEDFLYL